MQIKIGKKLVIFTTFLATFWLSGCQLDSVGLLNPKGIIAFEQRKLLFDTLALMLIVVLPVIIMSFTFVYHYQISHRIRDYKPNWSHSVFLESIWWGIPCAIIFVLAIITWKKTYELDPYRPISGYEAPLTVEVIALPWKWLFIYPDHNVASVNELVIPAGQQVEYVMTADNVPMSAFYIPQLGSQIYVMAGMKTRLHLVATSLGSFVGLNTQFNGDGFSDMHFNVRAVTAEEMTAWLKTAKQSKQHLTVDTYKQLLNQSMNDPVTIYSDVAPNLFQDAIHAYMQTYGTAHPRQFATRMTEQI